MKEEFLKICVGLLIIILIFITIQYFKILKSNKESPHSQTENDLNNGDIILHTKVDNNVKKINNDLNKLSKNIEEILINKYDIKENFNQPAKCGMDTSNIFYLHLTNKQLDERYKPEPFWKNRLFCVYKTTRLLSLNDSVGLENPTDEDYYYSLGDVILFKNYSKIMYYLIKINYRDTNQKIKNVLLEKIVMKILLQEWKVLKIICHQLIVISQILINQV